MLAPSASAVHFATILDEMADDELELMDYRPNRLGVFSIGSDGTCYSKSGTKLMSSQDPEGETTLVHDFQTDIKSCHAYSHGALDYVFVSLTSEIWRSINGGEFTKVLDMSDGKYAYIWSWSHSTDGDRLIVGEYGNKSTPSKVYLTNDGGNTWSTLFDTASYKETAGSHIHLVAIDPYDRDTFYINVGDEPNVRGLFVSTDGGSTWARKSGSNQIFSGLYGEVSNGHLACTFPDEDRVYFFSDNMPLIWEYRKSTGDLHLLAQLPTPYATYQAKTYSATMGEHGVSYFAMTDYVAGVNASYIWMTLDGTSFYRLNSHYLNTESGNYPIQSYGGRIYANGLSFKDLTRDEYGQLIGEVRSVEVHGDSMQYLNLKHPMKEVTLTITGKDTTNYVKNPSWEDGTTGWTGDYTVRKIVDVARDGEKALSLSLQEGKDRGTLLQSCNVVLSGETLVIRASVMVSEPTSKAPQIYVRYKAPDEVTKFMYIGTNEPANQGHLNEQMWSDLTYYWTPPAGATLIGFGMQINEDVEYYIDRFSISPDPIYVNEETPSGDVSFMLGDHLIEAGELAEGESKTISLPSDVWLDGLVPIVPLTGLAYTVSIDGTPVSESEQSIRETKKLLEQTIPVVVVLAVLGGLITMVGRIKI